MAFLNPKKIGTCAFGIKIGVILPGDDIVEKVYENVKDFVGDKDIICVTESVVARSQKNYVTIDAIVREIKKKLGVNEHSTLGVLYPIASRNRFSFILKGISSSVKKGKTIVQFSYPSDEVGNPIIKEEYVKNLGKGLDDKISMDELRGKKFLHPFTGVDYISLYDEIIKGTGSTSEIFLSNRIKEVLKYNPDAVIVASIHNRENIKMEILENYKNCITLQEICNDEEMDSWSEWGLLGSNITGNKLKLAPRNADGVAAAIQEKLKKDGKEVEVLIYGDGAYKDPDTGIYELADPTPAFGSTEGIKEKIRGGIKYKLFVENLYDEGKSRNEIEDAIKEIVSNERQSPSEKDSFDREGTTPRRMINIAASLADLVSGSADASTPVVVIKNLL